jgi:YHS domain-containing protein
MTKHLFPFFAALILGAVIALAVRSAKHQPTPAEDSSLRGAAGDAAIHHSASGAERAPSTASSAPAPTPVNTVCAICGMDVDPSIPTATYQGKTIGFGCRMCPPKFKADPDRYGPAYLANKVLEN